MNIVLIVGASGSGKDTLLNNAKRSFQNRDDIFFARRYVTRSPDSHEDNYYIEPEAFRLLKRADFFVSTWKAHDNLYGIPRNIVSKNRQDSTVICSISRTAIEDFEYSFHWVTTIQVIARQEILRERLASRGREHELDIEKRLARAAMPVHARKLITFDNSGSVEEGIAGFTRLLQRLCNSRLCFAN